LLQWNLNDSRSSVIKQSIYAYYFYHFKNQFLWAYRKGIHIIFVMHLHVRYLKLMIRIYSRESLRTSHLRSYWCLQAKVTLSSYESTVFNSRTRYYIRIKRCFEESTRHLWDYQNWFFLGFKDFPAYCSYSLMYLLRISWHRSHREGTQATFQRHLGRFQY